MVYGFLSAHYFSKTFTKPSENEVVFYCDRISKNEGPVLEAMCGAGRLLIPLLEAGYNIEGLDNSSTMLKLCRAILKENNLNTILYEQNMLNLKLDKKYSAIIVAMNSFQHFVTDNEVSNILQQFKNHLMPEGKLFIEMYCPFQGMEGPTQIKHMNQITVGKDQVLEKKMIIHLNYLNHTYVTHNKYRLYQNGRIVEKEEERFTLRWYQPGEFETLLLKAGFSSSQCIETRFNTNPDGMVYIALSRSS
ncbi:MAG: class I SAM-dependent methyltransferase [Gammaproteobacteria bacterium]|nr:class I SAM-dependent methyltransferase [Gammaproteobacteria bacterium]